MKARYNPKYASQVIMVPSKSSYRATSADSMVIFTINNVGYETAKFQIKEWGAEDEFYCEKCQALIDLKK